jgi:hypothetical protein
VSELNVGTAVSEPLEAIATGRKNHLPQRARLMAGMK